MKTIVIKEKQFPCVKRWVEEAIYIPGGERKLLKESIDSKVDKNGEVVMNFHEKSIKYLKDECPIGFMQSWAKNEGL